LPQRWVTGWISAAVAAEIARFIDSRQGRIDTADGPFDGHSRLPPDCRIEETVMNHVNSHELAKARVADRHNQAQLNALARATGRARRARPDRSRHLVLAVPFGRRVLAMLGARST
jgi:hypothetical protein